MKFDYCREIANVVIVSCAWTWHIFDSGVMVCFVLGVVAMSNDYLFIEMTVISIVGATVKKRTSVEQ